MLIIRSRKIIILNIAKGHVNANPVPIPSPICLSHTEQLCRWKSFLLTFYHYSNYTAALKYTTFSLVVVVRFCGQEFESTHTTSRKMLQCIGLFIEI